VQLQFNELLEVLLVAVLLEEVKEELVLFPLRVAFVTLVKFEDTLAHWQSDLVKL
jgi:hypothetical protein